MEETQERQMLPIGALLQYGRYRVVRYVASGGFGNTYEVEHTELLKRFAMKEFFMRGINQRVGNSVAVSQDENLPVFVQMREKFYHEAQRMANLEETHIVQVSDFFEENETAYYVMTLIDGYSLSALMRQQNHPFADSDVRHILPQILSALKYVHRQGLYHLDLKPGNVMMNGEGHCWLIDFGASKQLSTLESQTLSTSTGLCYTPGFAPSEQINGNTKRIGAWTDFYALGATLYNLMTNQIPPSPDDILNEGESVFVFPKEVSSQMRQLVIWLMRPLPKNRPQNVEEIEQRLEKTEKRQESVPTRSVAPVSQSRGTSQKTVKSNNQNSSKSAIKQKYNGRYAWVLLILGFIGLFLSPFVMLLYQGGRWYLFATLCALYQLHALTFVPCGLILNKLRPHSWYGGIFSGIILCATFCLFWGFANYDRDLLALLGMEFHYDSPNIFTIIFFGISIFVYLISASWGAHIAGIDISPFFEGLSDGLSQGMNYSGGAGWLIPIGHSIVNAKFMAGVLFSVVLFAGYYFSLHQLPTWYGNYINEKSLELQESRSQIEEPLSFADFELGSSIDSCLAVVDDSPNSSLESVKHRKLSSSIYESAPFLRVNENDFSAFIDSSLVVKTRWDNNNVELELYSHEGKLVAIELDVEHPMDSLIHIYSMKYGEPEEYMNGKNTLLFSYRNYIWTFKSGIIQIKGKNDDHSSKQILYFDRCLEPLLMKKEREEHLLKEFEERRQLDSISRVNEAREEAERQERILRDQEHRKSVEQI